MTNPGRIRIGNQTAISAPAIMVPFDYAVGNGFDAFEWFPDRNPSGRGWTENDLDPGTRARIRSTAARHDIRQSVHASWQANPLSSEAQPLLFASLDFARDIGASLLNIHLYTDEGIDAYVRSIAPLLSRLAEADIRLSIENTPLTTPAHFNELFARLRDHGPAGAECAGMCLDVGHANLCAPTRNDYLRYLGELDPRLPIIHIHLHENRGDRDSHLPIFTGPAGQDSKGIEALLERIVGRGFSGSVILEQWPDPPSLLNMGRDRLNRLLGDILSRLPNPGPPADPGVAHDVTHDVIHGVPRDAAHDEVSFAALLVDGNLRARSWREKLQFIRDLLARQSGEPSVGQLAYLAAYLRFLGTGEVDCAEDGRHFRPSHAARASGEIQGRLAAITDPGKTLLLRRIYPWLPSTGEAFVRPEPLTRIRDIAHRNDIPQDLKHEIKNTLQNKLHRCAGPEDLVTSAAILERITAPDARYSPDFVAQFRIFHEELKEFFNAASLEVQLRAIESRVSGADAGLIRDFLAEKENSARTVDGDLTALRRLTDLRRAFAARPSAQDLLLADIALENFAFVLLSRILNAVEPSGDPLPWDLLFDAFSLTVTNVSLSGFSTTECRAIDEDLAAWRAPFAPSDREQLLRLKATVDRGRRLAEAYSDRALSLFHERVAKLGSALGVAPHAIQTFVEGDIRGHVVFQLSRLATLMSANIRRLAGLPAGDVLVSGKAVGRVAAADSLNDFIDASGGPLLVLLKRAEGDEEIPSAVQGIVLSHEIPHLSHLGVRARQGNVVLVTCEDTEEFSRLRHFGGSWALLNADTQQFTLELSSAPADRPVTERQHFESIRVAEVCLNPDSPCISLDLVLPENGGEKAAGARRIEALSRRDGAVFQTPPALVVPFGVMERALRSVPAIEAEYQRLSDRLDGLQAAERAAVTERLRGIVMRLPVPEEIAGTVARRLKGQCMMVRSSANGEDLTELAGAGLYDSVANVPPGGIDDAVRDVWASLWTERAVLSRKQSGIAHEKVHMAVLIQEMVTPDYSFIMHTVNPISRNWDEVYVELATGLGEVLASAAVPGSPWRLVCNKTSGETRILAFASFSDSFQPASSGGTARRVVQYSDVRLSRDPAFARSLGGRFDAIARFMEDALRAPQDIEGALIGEDVYILQSRPQQGRL
jgi:phosphoglucan,water dikinase